MYAIKDTILPMYAFKKYKDEDEFLIYKSRIGTNIIVSQFATPIMYLSNKRIWISDWSFIQTNAPTVISLAKTSKIDKETWKTPIGLKFCGITFATAENPRDRVAISMKAHKGKVLFEAIKLLQKTIIEENRYMSEEEVKEKIIPLFAKN